MTRVCIICSHPHRLSIDRAIVQGANLTQLAKKYGIKYGTMYNHATEHIARQLSQVYEKREAEMNLDLLSNIDKIVSRAEKIFRRNYSKGKDLVALKALSEQRSTFELIAKISYALHQAKILEREQSREDERREEELAMKERLSVLTIEELKLLQRINHKLETQDRSITVVEDTMGFSPLPQRTRSPRPKPDERDTGVVKSKENDEKTDTDQPRPIFNNVTIPHTPWQYHPLNPLREDERN